MKFEFKKEKVSLQFFFRFFYFYFARLFFITFSATLYETTNDCYCGKFFHYSSLKKYFFLYSFCLAYRIVRLGTATELARNFSVSCNLGCK